MAGIGANGAVTTFPNSGEKMCAGCEYWTGFRDATYNDTAATSVDNKSAFCNKKKSSVFPQQTCSNFVKWSYLK